MTALDTKTSQTKLDQRKENRFESNRKVVHLRVYRKNPKQGKSSHFDKYEVPVQRWTTVLDALLHAKGYLDKSIAIRYSCRMASCGSCGMKINGIPRLACYTKVSEIDENIITCEPLPNFPVIRDLVGDFSDFFEHHRAMEPFIHNENANIVDKKNLTEFIQTPEDVENYLQFSYCIKCGLCYSACPSVGSDTKFPGPQALAQAYRYVADNRDDATKSRLNIVDNKHGIWRCHFAGSCSVVCPKGVDPALGIQLLRGHLVSFSKNDKKLAESRTRNLGRL
ncbi:MAG: succinate dehydrogenase iron-sulfur subunit [Nitrososphaeraceae archaeon]